MQEEKEASGLRVQEVSKTFGKNTVLQPTTLEVQPGTFCTLLGPSGSGKTTLLRLIAGFETPTTGRVILGGRDVTDVPPQKRNVGIVFQNYALFPHLTVAQNVSYPLEMRRVPRRESEREVKKALELVRLSSFADRKPGQLSGGQQQRVALARAIVFRPPVLLLDEPMAALDKRLREEMQFEIRALQRQLGITTVAVTHDQTEALVMSDVVLVINDGVVQQRGAPDELYRHPKNKFVAGFVGESNLLAGELLREVDANYLRLESGLRIPLSKETLTANGRVVALLRPEAIELNRAEHDGFSLAARVTEKIFCGETYRLTLRLEDGTTVLARPNGMLNQGLPEAGDTTRVSWQLTQLTLIPQ